MKHRRLTGLRLESACSPTDATRASDCHSARSPLGRHQAFLVAATHDPAHWRRAESRLKAKTHALRARANG